MYELTSYTNKPRNPTMIESEIRNAIYDSFQKQAVDLTIPTIQRKIANDDM